MNDAFRTTMRWPRTHYEAAFQSPRLQAARPPAPSCMHAFKRQRMHGAAPARRRLCVSSTFGYEFKDES